MTFGVHCSWNSPNSSAKLTGRYVMGAPLSIVEALQRLAGLVLAAKPQRLLAARDRGDRRDHRGGAAGADLDEILDLVPAHRPVLDAQAHVLGDGAQAVVGHALEDRVRFRRDVGAVAADADEVRGAELVDEGVCRRIEIERDGIALLL